MKNNFKIFIVICTIFLQSCSLNIHTISNDQLQTTKVPFSLNDNNCITPEHTFSYTVWGKANSSTPMILPGSPWKFETNMPGFDDGAVSFSTQDWILTTIEDKGEQNVWILRSWTNDQYNSFFSNMQILVYKTRTREWITISNRVAGTSAVVGEIFTLADGTIWARNYWDDYISFYEPPYRVSLPAKKGNNLPLLSRYDEEKKQFMPVEALSLPEGKLEKAWNKIVLDKNGLFWIFVQTEGIYTFDPKSGNIIRQADIPGKEYEFIVRSTDFDKYGNIYFSDDSSSIYKFDQVTKKIERIGGTPLPFENKYFLVYHGIRIDHLNRLWVGNIGWAEQKEILTWNQLIPSPIFIGSTDESPNAFQIPWLLFESEDGKLWYRFEYGVVWMDAELEQWCWVTNQKASLAEDSNGNLWMIVGGNIYTYPISDSLSPSD